MPERHIKLVLDIKDSEAILVGTDAQSKVLLGKLMSTPETRDLIKFFLGRLSLETQRIP